MTYLRGRRLIELLALDRPWIGELFARGAGAGAAPAETWDGAYQDGRYDQLLDSDRRHHHRLLAAWVGEIASAPRILDIGCGDGAFYASVRGLDPARYLGVDLSPAGIERARARFAADLSPGSGPGRVEFVVGDGAAFATDEIFDAIVFPDCLEYLGPPEAFLAHYAPRLAPGGVFGFTQWLGVKPLRLWRRVRAATEVVDEVVVHAPWGGAWQVWTCRPR